MCGIEKARKGAASEKTMRKGLTRTRRAAVVAMTAASLSLPMLSIARADPPADQPHAVQPKNHAKTNWQSAAQRKELYGSTRTENSGRCAWPYQNQFPPCMSTWPAGDPHYHGPRPGPTFNDE
jgi:hypothetical protein